MPDAFHICWKAQDNLKLATTVRELDILVESNQSDTIRAAAQMCDLGVDCIVSLGGDGTNRALAKAWCSASPAPVYGHQQCPICSRAPWRAWQRALWRAAWSSRLRPLCNVHAGY